MVGKFNRGSHHSSRHLLCFLNENIPLLFLVFIPLPLTTATILLLYYLHCTYPSVSPVFFFSIYILYSTGQRIVLESPIYYQVSKKRKTTEKNGGGKRYRREIIFVNEDKRLVLVNLPKREICIYPGRLQLVRLDWSRNRRRRRRKRELNFSRLSKLDPDGILSTTKQMR